MGFEDFDWTKLFPSYLTDDNKERLKNALKQFRDGKASQELDFQNFYLLEPRDFFMQTDVVIEIRHPFWNNNEEVLCFEKKYCTSMIVTNTCDISDQNSRELNKKECLFAPIMDLEIYIQELRSISYNEEKLNQLIENIKKQLISNIFYLPPNHKDGREYIVILDKMFWYPTTDLNELLPTIHDDKLFSLNHFGYYLFMLKLSYHLCRLPEACDRIQQSA
jgi:hypothetical protein